jgi:hypothetical protein
VDLFLRCSIMTAWKCGNEPKMNYIRLVRFANQYMLLFISFGEVLSHKWIPRTTSIALKGEMSGLLSNRPFGTNRNCENLGRRQLEKEVSE